MEHFITIAFWIMTLSVCCLAKPRPISEANIGLMNDTVKCPEDSKFYTPSNVKYQCITAAMDCFEKELETVAKECEVQSEDHLQYIYQAKEYLAVVIRERSDKEEKVPKNSTECACENWTETSFPDFLKEMKSLLEKANAADSRK